ncbi:hypothetical protein GCM10027046_23200 [Uliginosibacterium flavum]
MTPSVFGNNFLECAAGDGGGDLRIRQDGYVNDLAGEAVEEVCAQAVEGALKSIENSSSYRGD